ncbi:hypothetical protein [Yersinia enterocolitica]|uniref:hypothetical protein n=1 Tax=Yersinia enterocolitica TaxID=630 RepID=UPI003CFF5AB5
MFTISSLLSFAASACSVRTARVMADGSSGSRKVLILALLSAGLFVMSSVSSWYAEVYWLFGHK